ncbi:MAG TPA: phosphoserine transaminase, partial [Rhizomicrobium sp.]|nr:phosphoserine transaminase [Rhizomicrobium sp.]
MELAMWSMLGPRPVDCFAWESFGEDWITDAVKQLKIKDARVFKAAYGALPDLKSADPSHDIVFTWNGTTGGVRVPDADWISAAREGITICDATSAAFAMDLAWDKLDATTFSWQKVLGGEAAHGMLVLSPRAVERLKSYTPPWPLPKIFRLTKGGKLNEAVFQGETLNTPSMLALEDYLDALSWAEGIGGLTALKARVAENFTTLEAWVNNSDWVDFLSSVAAYRSNTSVCLKIVDPGFTSLSEDARYGAVKRFADLLEAEAVAFDVAGHRNAPPGLRIWCGATVERADIAALTPWLDWAWKETRP